MVPRDDGGFAQRLRRAWLQDAMRRDDFPYSYRELARQLSEMVGREIHETTPRAWFHGQRPRLELIAAIADILKTDRDELAFGPKLAPGADAVRRRVEAVKAVRRRPPSKSAGTRPSGPNSAPPRARGA